MTYALTFKLIFGIIKKMTKPEMQQKEEPVHIGWLIITLMLLCICAYLTILMTLGKPIARYKAQKSENILQGCLYDTGDRSKYGPIVRINDDEHRSVIADMMIKEFPASSKSRFFDFNLNKLNSSHCYKIRYIIVDFNIFTDSVYFRQYFIYDYDEY